jgi:hypothetical protein
MRVMADISAGQSTYEAPASEQESDAEGGGNAA